MKSPEIASVWHDGKSVLFLASDHLLFARVTWGDDNTDYDVYVTMPTDFIDQMTKHFSDETVAKVLGRLAQEILHS